MRLGIYGGTFDPPHLGHRTAAEHAIKALSLDRLLIIPDNLPPHKELSEGSPSGEDRLELCRRCFRGLPKTEVSDLEMRREGRSYTYETLRCLKELFPEEELWLLMGTDMAVTLDHWKRSDEIFRLASIGVFAREDGDDPELQAAAERYRREYGAGIEVIGHVPVPASSTEIRSLLPRREGDTLLGEEVYRYILRKRLYGARPNIGWLRRTLAPMQAPGRLPHVEGCEETAAALALHWGEDEGDAREAALLHDITKGYDLREQLKSCEKYGIIPDELESESTSLLHSMTASGLAREEFGAPDRIASAIRWHTTGRADMTLLEKIVCLADFMEPTRHFADLTEVRRLAYEDLDAALLLSLHMTEESLRRREIPVHRHTLEAIASLETRTRR